ncbi:MAG: EamA family transporter, partial [Lentisphaeria bacterium]|nr:EamA family transporter [Lentisphaeria bacterium]
MQAIIYAVLSLLFSSGNDLLFKFFANNRKSIGIFVSVVGVVWGIYAACTLDGMPANMTQTIIWGSISGLFSIGGNLLLIGAMSKLSAGVCSTIYRLNLVPAVLGAWLILGEQISLPQWCGVMLAIFAVLAFIPKSSERKEFSWSCFFMVLAGSLMRAGMGLSYRYGFDTAGADRKVVVLINALFWVIGGLLWYLIFERKKCSCDRKTIGFGMLSGIFVTGIVVFMALSLQYGKAAVVLPVAQMSFLLTGAAGVIFLKEKFTLRTAAAFACGCGAILVMCTLFAGKMATPETSKHFCKHIDPESGVVSYIFDSVYPGLNHQSLYFTQKSMTDDGRFLVFHVSGGWLGNQKNLAVYDFLHEKAYMIAD